jgi:hypothetical protein
LFLWWGAPGADPRFMRRAKPEQIGYSGSAMNQTVRLGHKFIESSTFFIW